MKLTDILEREYDIVSKRKMFFLVPAILVVLAIIAGFIYGITGNGIINKGLDFTESYSANVTLATRLTDDNYNDYLKKIKDIFEDLENEDGENYGLKISSAQKQGTNDTASIYIKFKPAKAPKDVDSKAFMQDEVNVRLEEKLHDLFSISATSADFSNSTVTVEYSEVILLPMLSEIKQKIADFATKNTLSIDTSTVAISNSNNKIITFTAPEGIGSKLNELSNAISFTDETFAGTASVGGAIDPAVSFELLVTVILFLALALVLILVYIMFRFGASLPHALIAGLAVLHDLLIMFSLVVIFHVEINVAFLAILAFVMLYSLINSATVFDRIRENLKLKKNADKKPAFIANLSINEMLKRTVNICAIALIGIAGVAAIAVPSTILFVIPLIFGLIATVYSSVFLTPTAWAVWTARGKKNDKLSSKSQNSTQNTPVQK